MMQNCIAMHICIAGRKKNCDAVASQLCIV
jgi:hypothetical protein